jgi:hypothetical protein
MTLRAVLVATLALICGPALAASSAARSVPDYLKTAPLVFYVARGANDACGPGCDSWIAVEGRIDGDAAGRFRKFLRPLRDRHLPMYFNSPGGDLDQALAMGAVLRETPVIARVARTVVMECGFEAQDSDACLKLKRSGRELHADLRTFAAICNSACPYLILGAATREVAPEALLGVHSSKVLLRFSGFGRPSEQMIAASMARGRDRADRLLSGYFAKMGVDSGLLDLARTVRFEDVHFLTREEIVRFGIDRREFVETSWAFENNPRSMARKSSIARNGADNSYRLVQLRLYCFNADQFELDFQSHGATSFSIVPTMRISNEGSVSSYFRPSPTTSQGFQIWGLLMNRASALALAEKPQFDVTETSQGSDGRRLAHSTKFSTEGLAGALARLIETCPPSVNSVLRQSSNSAAK